MALHFTDPRLYVSPNGKTWPAESDVAHGSYVTQGYHPPAGPDEDINTDIRENKVVPAAAEVLARAGHDGAELTTQDKTDLCRYADQGGASFAYNIHQAYYAMWQARGDFLVTQPPPQPPSSGGVQGEDLYETGHEISAKLPKGSRARRGVYFLENAWGAINALIKQATTDGVPTSEQELMAARNGLLGSFYTLNAAFQQERDFLIPAEVEECQTSSDQYWDAIHAARARANAAKDDGWQLVAGDPRAAVYKYSRHNRIAWTGLSNLTAFCGLYGVKGELQENGQRSPEYVDSFESWDSQDPMREQIGGGGGINIPGGGPTLREATKGNSKQA